MGPDGPGTTLQYPPEALTPAVDPPAVFVDPIGRLGTVEPGRPATLLTPDRPIEVRSAAWGPRAERIAFVAPTDTTDPGAAADLFVLDDTTGAEPRLLSGGTLRVVGLPSWSPDGTRIAFATADGGLWHARADGGEILELTAAGPFAARPTWSPDGRWILHVGRDEADRSGIFRIRPDGADREILAETSRSSWTPRYSPDGARIIFDDDGDIGVANADGSSRGLLTQTETRERAARWSPDGRYVAYDAGFGGNGIEIIDGDSGALLDTFRPRLFGFAGGPVWSPDGTRIAFVSGDSLAIGTLGEATRWSTQTPATFVAWRPTN